MGAETLTKAVGVEDTGRDLALVQPEVPFEELDSRQNAGINVSLLWRRVQPPEFRINVVDTKNKEGFSLGVEEGETPAEVYKHPFAYAARHSINATLEGYVNLTEA